jgi:ubiquitin carboxyl-terminal hydrolase 4/11/15
MFELGYFSGIKEMVPSGWNAVDEDKTYPALASRNPQVRQPRDLDLENGYDQDSRDGSETSQDNDNFHDSAFSSTTRMVEEESDDDELAGPAPRVSPSPVTFVPEISLDRFRILLLNFFTELF